MKKLYVIQKYVVATSISDALKKESKEQPSDVYLDHDWKKANMPNTKEPARLGYNK